MVRRPLLFALLAALILSAWTAPLEAKWRRYRSPNFELYADGAKGRAEDVLNYLEQVRDVFGKISDAEVNVSRPVRVVAFGSERDFARLRGKGDSAYAFYTQSRDRNYIVFQELASALMYEVAVHEYVHLRTRELGLPLPLWLSEGFAELYSTIRPEGSNIVMGAVPTRYRNRNRLPRVAVDELVTANLSDPKLSKNRLKVASVYVRSWALTSMLTMHPDYNQKFVDFLAAIIAGETGEDAFSQVYAKTLDQVDRQLEKEMAKPTVRVMSFPTEWNRDKQELEGEEVDDLEAGLMMADLLYRTGRHDEARAEYAALAATYPDSPAVQHGVGQLAVDDAESLAAFEQAAELGSDDPYLALDHARKLLDQPEPDHAKIQHLLAAAVRRKNPPDEAHLLLAAYADQQGEHSKATLHLRKIDRVHPAQAFAHYCWLMRSVRSSGSDLQAGVAAGAAKQAIRTAGQLTIFEKLLMPEAPSSFEQIEALEAEGKRDEAAAALVRVGQEYPKVWETYQRLAGYAGAEEKARLEAGARQMRWDAAADGRRGVTETMYRISLLDQARFHDLSQAFFESLILLVPKPEYLLNNRAYELANRGFALDTAVEMAEQAADLSPDSGAIQDTLGWVYHKAGRHDDSVQVLEPLLKERPKDPTAWYHYAAALGGAGRKDEALESFEKALDLKPSERLRKRIEDARDQLGRP